MRAGRITGRYSFELAEVDDPTPAAGQAVVDVLLCGICGSDVHAYTEGWAYNPGVCGHEWVGVVREVAAGVRVVSEGDRVTAGIAPGCGTCAECRAALPEYCSVAFSGYTGRLAPTNGGFARSIAIDANRLCPMPAGITDIAAAIVEPTAVALHGVRRSSMRMGDVVAVVGCGPIGLLALQCARVGGAGHVIAVEVDEARRARALAVGADVALPPGPELREHLNEVTGGLRADIAFDCAGVPATLQAAVDLVRRGGSVCMLGVTSGDATVQPIRWMSKEVRVDTSFVFTLEEMAIAADLIRTGRIDATALHDGTITLDDLGRTIDDLAHRRIQAVKLLVDPTAG